MGNKLFGTVVFTLCLSVLCIMLTGCEKMKVNVAEDMVNSELLSTDNVIKLLNDNGAGLKKATNFPVDLSLCKVSGKMPQPYISSESGIYYMFYEYGGYGETGNLARESVFYEYPDCAKSFSNYTIPGGIAGKNLYICQWFPELGSWADETKEVDRKTFDTVVKERALIKNILYERAFNKKEVILTGKGEFWEVKIPVEYIYNLRESESGIPERLFVSKSETFLKYLKLENELPDVTSMNWSYSNKESTLTYDKGEGSILNKDAKNGFYKASSSTITDFNPETDQYIAVTITWGNGETEKITCSISKVN